MLLELRVPKSFCTGFLILVAGTLQECGAPVLISGPGLRVDL